jgi:hypothetical protein
MASQENEDLLRDLNIASQDVKKATAGKSGEGAEKKYGQAYAACVKAGIKPPLKRKYRP